MIMVLLDRNPSLSEGSAGPGMPAERQQRGISMFEEILLVVAGIAAIFIVPASVVAVIYWRGRQRETET